MSAYAEWLSDTPRPTVDGSAYQLADTWLRDTTTPTAPDEATYERMTEPTTQERDVVRETTWHCRTCGVIVEAYRMHPREECARRQAFGQADRARTQRLANDLWNARYGAASQAPRPLPSPGRAYTGADAWVA